MLQRESQRGYPIASSSEIVALRDWHFANSRARYDSLLRETVQAGRDFAIRRNLVEGEAIRAYLRAADPLVLCQRGMVIIYEVSSYRDRRASNFLVPRSFHVKGLRGNCTALNFISLLKSRVITSSCDVRCCFELSRYLCGSFGTNER